MEIIKSETGTTSNPFCFILLNQKQAHKPVRHPHTIEEYCGQESKET